MVIWNKKTKTIKLTTTDLIHCGFDWDEYYGTLFLAGIDDEAAQKPDRMIVDLTYPDEHSKLRKIMRRRNQ